MGNPVVHVELIGPDPDAMRRFYRELFGWDASPGAPVAPRISSPEAYSFIQPAEQAAAVPGGIGGGAGFEAHALFSVGVAEVGAALQQVERLGGTVVLPPQRNDAGGVVVGRFRDPAGNLAGLAAPA